MRVPVRVCPYLQRLLTPWLCNMLHDFPDLFHRSRQGRHVGKSSGIPRSLPDTPKRAVTKLQDFHDLDLD
jgi:hypothetical protein